MSEFKKISNNEYEYKGYIIARYENANSQVRWSIERERCELAVDLGARWVAKDQIDQGRFA